MKKRNFILISLFATAMIAASCSNKCNEFNSDIINWMPYKLNDTIILTQGTKQDSLTVELSQINHTDKIAHGVKCACENNYMLRLSSDSINIDVNFYDVNQIDESNIIINDVYLSFSEQLDNYDINGSIFQNVIVYENTNPSSTYTFEKVYIVKNIGIVLIIGNNTSWLINNSTKKQILKSDIEVNDFDCN